MLLESPQISYPFFIDTFKTKDQKNLASLSALSNNNLHFFLLQTLKKELKLSEHEFKKLNIIDYFLIILQWRMFYVSNSVQYQISCASCETPTPFHINLTEHLSLLDHLFNHSHRQTLEHSHIKIELDVPAIIHAPNLKWDASLFLKKINEHDLTDISPLELQKIYDSLPQPLVKEIQEYVSQFFNIKIEKYFHLSCKKCNNILEQELNIFNILTFVEFIMKFNYEQIVTEYMILSYKCNMNGLYVDNIPPIEREKYINLLIEYTTPPDNSTSNLPESPNSDFGF